jgi:hypothetical protein
LLDLDLDDKEGELYLKASDTQYEMKLVTPHFRAWRGTGSRSLFVLYDISVLRLPKQGPSLSESIPACIAVRKCGPWLLDLERKMRLLNDRHLAITQAAVCLDRSSKCGGTSFLSISTDTRASLSPLGLILGGALCYGPISLAKYDKGQSYHMWC